MRPDFHRDPTPRHRAEDFTQCFPTRTDLLFSLNLAGFIQ